MGVHGLWRLIEPSGKPVPLESLENKVLAVDISIWLHQAVKGFQDSKGASLPNAHLLGIFHRLCKLLYFRIKPVFVFDGGVPVLKKQTIAKRNQLKSKNSTEANRIQKQLINTLLKHSAVNKVIVENVKANLEIAKKPTDMFELPPSQFEPAFSSSEDESETSMDTSENSSSPYKTWDLHTVDEKSSHFKSLPADVRHEILTELKETRKQNSWGRIHELPTRSDDFSGYQMKRLLKRYSVQVSLEEAEKEMGGASLSLGELENLLKDHGVINKKDVGGRIASDENKRYFLIKNVKKAMAEGDDSNDVSDEDQMIIEEDESSNKDLEKAIQLSLQDVPSTSNSTNFDNKTDEQCSKKKTVADVEYEQDLEKAIQLSLQGPSINYIDSDLFISDNEDSSSNSDMESNSKANEILTSVKNYMTEYSGLTPSEISKIMSGENASTHNVINKRPIILEDKLQAENKNDADVIQDKFDNFKKPQLSKLLVAKPQTNSTVTKNTQRSNKNTTNVDGQKNESDFGLTPSEISKIMSGENASNHNVNNKRPIVQEDKLQAENKKYADVVQDKFAQLSKLLVAKPQTNSTVTKDTQGSNKNTTDVDEQKNESDFVEVISSDEKPEETANNDDVINKVGDNEKVEIISDNSDSDSDFLEVTSKTDTEENKNALEIMIRKDARLNDTDDIFSDIFSTTKEKEKIPRNINQGSIEADKKVESNKSEQTENNDELNKDNLVGEDNSNTLLNEVLSTANVKNGKQLSKEELKTIEIQLDEEKNELLAKQSLKERLATNITEQMRTETQELLQLFGIPYIIAPMEAEAQCAFLDNLNLTNGTITDDSDIWLFGGGTVYKNFFNQSRRVLEYKSESIQHSFKLSRYEMILLALLVGSDYTTGVQGVGPVTALEILAHFPLKKQNDLVLTQDQLVSGLVEFKRWIKGEYNIKGRGTLRSKLKNIVLNDQFPSLQVVNAYLDPTVETSNENFTWGKPDLVSLIDYAKEKFGWDQKKSESILKPVFKSLEQTSVQNKITNYFKTKHKIQGTQADERMSKRVKTALDKIGKSGTSSDEDKTKIKNTKISKKKKTGEVKAEKPTTSRSKPNQKEDSSLPLDDDLKVLQQTRKVSRKRAKQIENELRYEMEQKQLAAANSKIEDPKTIFKRKIHSKEVIPQKQKDKADILRTKMKAIEMFRKSKQGPGFIKKRVKKPNLPKEDACLSEDSDS